MARSNRTAPAAAADCQPGTVSAEAAARSFLRFGSALPVAVVAAVAAAPAATAAPYVVQPGDTLSGIASRHATTSRELARVNGLADRHSIRAGQRIEVPGPAAPARPAPSAPSAATYTVRSGDTVGHIALRLGTTTRAIVEANGLDSRAAIRVGQVLRLPGGPAAGGGAPAPAAPAATGGGSYTVRPGDTVSHIALRAGTTTRAIVEANGLDSRASIRVGQVLRLPGASGRSASAPAATPAPVTTALTGTHTVRSGEALSTIAGRYGTSTRALMEANGIADPDRIRIGQVLRVPGAPVQVEMATSFAGRTYAPSVTQAAAANKAALQQRDVPSRDQMRAIIADAARAQGVPVSLALAVGFQESGFNHRSVSPANAIGAMQVIPSSGRWASDLVGRPLDLLDPYDNATAGAAILRSLLRSAPDEATAIAGYYQGMSSVKRNGLYSDTRRYVANVQTLRGRF